jgi:hypothetical protein
MVDNSQDVTCLATASPRRVDMVAQLIADAFS